jgi:hypothetical protein
MVLGQEATGRVGAKFSFYGYLGLDGDPLDLLVDFRFEDDRLSIRASHDSLGSWPTSQVQVTQFVGGIFSVRLGSEEVLFAPDDALRFSQHVQPNADGEGPPNLSRHRETRTQGRHLRASLADEDIYNASMAG